MSPARCCMSPRTRSLGVVLHVPGVVLQILGGSRALTIARPPDTRPRVRDRVATLPYPDERRAPRALSAGGVAHLDRDRAPVHPKRLRLASVERAHQSGVCGRPGVPEPIEGTDGLVDPRPRPHLRHKEPLAASSPRINTRPAGASGGLRPAPVGRCYLALAHMSPVPVLDEASPALPRR